MAWERRASERADARAKLGRGHASPRLACALALALTAALGACRQTVVLDPLAHPDGGAGAGGTAPVVDAAAEGMGGGSGSSGGNHLDGGRLDLPPFCQLQRLQTKMRTPDVIVSVDRSASMQAFFGSGTRLEVIQQQVRALVSKYAKHVFFGYEEFPSPTGTGGPMGGCSNGQGCCAGYVTPPTFNNFRAIDAAISACDSNGNGCVQTQRPIADALQKCHHTFMSLNSTNDTGHRYVVLLTGGDPTCQGSDPMSTPCDDAAVEVTKLSQDSIETAVFGVGEGAANSACLEQIAAPGNFPTGGTQSYRPTATPNELSGALATVFETIATEACTIDVRTPPADPNNVSLFLDNVMVLRDGSAGWEYDRNSNTTITVHGTSCTALLQASQVELISGTSCLPPHT
jgi:hypothetical protein